MIDRDCYAISREVKPGSQLAGDTITFDSLDSLERLLIEITGSMNG